MLSTAACLSQLKWTHFQSKPRKLKDLETFDDASRGPWGSIRLLFARGTGSLDAAVRLGCAITVLVLAMETFGQQLLSFPERRVAVAEEVARFPTIQNLVEIPNPIKNKGLILSDRLLQSRLSLMESIYGRTTAAPYECGASECSWGSHVTLGLCSSCRDISDTQPQCKVKVLVEPKSWELANGTMYNTTSNTTTLECHYPGEAQYVASIRSWNLEYNKDSIVPDPNNASTWNYTTAINVETRIGDAYFEMGQPAVALNISVLMANDAWERPQITACTLNYCAWVYENSTAQGQNFNVGNLNKYILGYEHIQRQENGPGGNFRKSNFTFRANGTGFPSDKHNDTFLVYGEADSELTSHLSTILRSTSYDYYSTTVDDHPTPGLGQAMLANPNVTEMADRMATGMTNVWRQYENEQAVGTAWESVAFIHVEWVWLTLPAAAVLGASVVLIMTLIQNRRTVLWKSSVLPYSFRTLQGWEDTEFDMETLEEIRERAKEMTGQLVGDVNERVRLVKS
jgi:chorismate mutase